MAEAKTQNELSVISSDITSNVKMQLHQLGIQDVSFWLKWESSPLYSSFYCAAHFLLWAFWV